MHACMHACMYIHVYMYLRACRFILHLLHNTCACSSYLDVCSTWYLVHSHVHATTGVSLLSTKGNLPWVFTTYPPVH